MKVRWDSHSIRGSYVLWHNIYCDILKLFLVLFCFF
jgi:hypothetical protein